MQLPRYEGENKWALRKVADPNSGAANGVHIQAGNTDFSASDSSVETLSNAFLRWWFGTLDWLANHPMYGVVVAVLLLVAMVRWYRLRREKLNQEHEYRIHRANVQIQLSLPFPANRTMPAAGGQNPRLGQPTTQEHEND